MMPPTVVRALDALGVRVPPAQPVPVRSRRFDPLDERLTVG